ncbi:MAG: Flp pilus assembly complex ATPase component TadA [Alphaproteobacteria bacterium]|nr:Flp pilus assembly complex ATPase component TadA [Alphaproteobacteria bacterium]MBR6730525.1 Flp pilus assembly complex ATPase component TadA [Alphaproteobacteria bacterium]
MGELSIADTYRVLESALRPLSYWYNQDNVEEVAVDSPGGIWLRLRGRHAHPWHYYEDPKLTREYLNNIMYIIANSYDYAFDPTQGTPTVYATLPGGHRFTGIAGRNVMYDNNDLTGGIAMAIRVYKEDVNISMSDFGLSVGERLRPLNRLKQVEDPDDPFERLMLSIKRGDHVLISGATATGKTTFLNNLIKVLDPHKRILTIEDTRELIVPHKNRVHIVLPRTELTNNFDYKKVIDLAVRFTPDAIIGGEISTSNAGALWELMGSGHENCFATIHAENPDAAYKAFIGRILHSYPTTDREKTYREMKEKLRVVQINRDGNIRAVTEVT